MQYLLSRFSFGYQKISTCLRQPSILNITRLLYIGSGSLATVVALFVMHALEGRWTWIMEVRDGLSRHIPQLSAEMLPIPVAFLLWVRLIERNNGKFALSFSPFFSMVSVAAFVATQELVQYPDLRQYAFALAVVAELFIVAPFWECLKRAIRKPRPAVVAVIAATAACNYYFLMRTIWEWLGGWTAQAVHFILRVFGADITTGMQATNPIIGSQYFAILIYPACNGLEGVFLFSFMLSVALLIDWDLFKRRSIVLLYAFGIIYMFLFNILRITSLFVLGYWANNPHAWGWMHALQGAPVYLFHSYVGWVFYLVAFGIFAAWMYRPVDSKRQTVDSSK